jgi:ankyrin repeat protein
MPSPMNVMPLYFVLVKRQLAVAQLLLDDGAEVSNSQDKDDQTQLHWAQGEEVSRFLPQHGANVNTLDIKGRTPLQASESGRIGDARVLLEHGVDVGSQDPYHTTFLHWHPAPGTGMEDILTLFGCCSSAALIFMRATSKGDYSIL